MPLIPVNGINVYYEEHGVGPELLLIGGLSNDTTDLTPLTELLAQSFRVITFDNRGTGRTDKPQSEYSIELMAEDSVALLKALDIQKAYVVGLSLGSRIALAMILDHPTFVVKAALVGSGNTFGRTSARPLIRVLRGIARLVDARKPNKQPQYAFNLQIAASAKFNPANRLSEINTPTVIIHGTKDRIAPFKYAEELHAKIRGSTLISFQSGHTFIFSRQKAFVNALTQFFIH